MKDILFHSHLGLGDQIACNGLVHYLSYKFKKIVYVVVKERNMVNIEFMYKDFKNIVPISISDDPKIEKEEVNNLVSKLNLELKKTLCDVITNKQNWDYSFYTNMNVPYSAKLECCRLPTIDNKQEIIDKFIGDIQDFAFVHYNESRNPILDYNTNLPVILNQPSLNIFEMSIILKRAKELHMTGSSLMCLAECMNLPLPHQKAYYYTSPSNNLHINNNDKWERI